MYFFQIKFKKKNLKPKIKYFVIVTRLRIKLMLVIYLQNNEVCLSIIKIYGISSRTFVSYSVKALVKQENFNAHMITCNCY